MRKRILNEFETNLKQILNEFETKKSPNGKGKMKVQIEKGNKSPNRKGN